MYYQSNTATSGSRLVVMLDLQNVGISANSVKMFDDRLMADLDNLFPRFENENIESWELFRAYPGVNQEEAAKELRRLEWRIPRDRKRDWDARIIQDSKSTCMQDPENTILVLCTRDGDYADLIRELEEDGVDVYIASQSMPSHKLLNAIGGNRYWIRL